jgi:nitrous oxidase accessory protein NosD
MVGALALVAGTLAALAPPAAAVTAITGCGQTVTTDAQLTVDLTCPAGDGIVVGADGITVDLAGHTVTGSPTGNGIDVTDHDDVIVGGGSIVGFITAVRVFQGSGVTAHLLDITVAPGPLTSGVVLGDTQSAVVADNVVRGGGIGVLVETSQGSTIERNQFDGPQQGVILNGASNSLVTQNRTTGSAAGIVIATESADTTVTDNVLTTGVSGIYVDPSGNTGTTLRANTATDFASDGIFIDAGTSVTNIVDNRVERNNTGITVRTATTTLTANHAFDNTTLGIDAIAGVTDGGGNEAAGNGDPRQCVGVVCTAPNTPLSPLQPLAPASVLGTPRFTG